MQASTRSVADARALSRQIGAFFLYLANAGNRDLLPEASKLELSLTQLKAMFLVGRAAEPLSMGSLAESLGLSFAATSRAVDALCRRGLMDRDEDPDDRRVKRVRLTSKGRRSVDRLTALRLASIERLIATRIKSFERLLAGFSVTERRKLGDALDEILARPEVARYCPRGKPR